MMLDTGGGSRVRAVRVKSLDFILRTVGNSPAHSNHQICPSERSPRLQLPETSLYLPSPHPGH